MTGGMIGNADAAAQRGGEHKADFALLQHIGSAIAQAGFRSGIGHQRHAHGGAVKIGRLARVAHVEFHVIGAS
jgi:hypothetical protein